MTDNLDGTDEWISPQVQVNTTGVLGKKIK